MHPRTTQRRRGRALTAAAAVAGLTLGACADPGGTGSPSATASPTASGPATTPPATSTPSPDGPWGGYRTRAEACSAVAEDLVVLALLPANLSANPAVDRVQAVEDQVAAVRTAAPPQITADLARVQLLVDSYGEELESDPDARFDGRELDEALVPVREWLEQTCRNGG